MSVMEWEMPTIAGSSTRCELQNMGGWSLDYLKINNGRCSEDF